MNKAELVNAIASKIGETKVKTGEFVEALISSVTEALSKGEDLTLVGFGTFSTAARNERKGRNPQTGADLQIPAHTVAKFSAGKNLRESVVYTKTPKKVVPKVKAAKAVVVKAVTKAKKK